MWCAGHRPLHGHAASRARTAGLAANDAAGVGAPLQVHRVRSRVAAGHLQSRAAPGEHLAVARVAEGLGVSWHTANSAILAEGKRVLVEDPGRFNGVAVIGVDEHVVRHEALLFRMEVRDLHRLVVAAAG
ncbi:MAG: family transposase [Marmoricola sp.]|nr:family transposase [Marmoricola sp.]